MQRCVMMDLISGVTLGTQARPKKIGSLSLLNHFVLKCKLT